MFLHNIVFYIIHFEQKRQLWKLYLVLSGVVLRLLVINTLILTLIHITGHTTYLKQ